MDPSIPDRRWLPPLALTMLAGVVIQGASSGLQQGIPSIAPALREQVQATPAALSLLLAATGIGVTCAVLMCGMLADRFGERSVVLGGLLLCTVSLVLASRQDVFTGMLFCLLLAGLGLAGPNGATARAVASRAGPRRLGLALGLRQMAVPLGTAGASYVLPRVAAEHGAGGSLLVFAGVYLVAAALAAVAFTGRQRPTGAAGPPLRASVTDRHLLAVMVGCGLFTFPQWGYIGYLVLYLHDARGWDGVTAATALTGVLLCGALVRAVAGWLSDRLPGRRAELLAGSAALPGLLSPVAGIAVGADSSLAVPLLVAAALASMTWNGLAYTVVAQASPPDRLGAVHGVLSTVLFGAGAVAAVVIGMLRAVSTWSVTWTSLAVFTAAGLALLWYGTHGSRAAPTPRDLARCQP